MIFQSAGNYILKVEVENTTGADPVAANNSITDTIRQLSNDPIILPFTDDLETAISRKYYKAIVLELRELIVMISQIHIRLED